MLQHTLHNYLAQDDAEHEQAVIKKSERRIEWAYKNNFKLKIKQELTKHWQTIMEVQYTNYSYLKRHRHGYGVKRIDGGLIVRCVISKRIALIRDFISMNPIRYLAI